MWSRPPSTPRPSARSKSKPTNRHRTSKVTVERYPELTATAGFRDLQTQLEGTENRIAVERGKFNEAVQKYNTKLRRFPTSLLAGILGFDKKGYFTAPAEAAEPVQVEFNF